MSHSVPSGFEPFDGGGEFLELVGPVYARADGERRVFGIRLEERHRNVAGVAHGGLLATLVDFALGRAVNEAAEEAAVTVSLTIDFLAPAEPGDWVEAHSEVERVGGKLAFADCSLKVEGRELVRGRAVFAVLS